MRSISVPAPSNSAEESSSTWSSFFLGARHSLSLGLGVAVFGAVFGVLARQAGLSVAECALMSLTVFAGASQFVALEFWGPALPVAGIIATTLVVNLRHVLMGAALAPELYGIGPLARSAGLFVMIDESWALTVSRATDLGYSGQRLAYMVGSGLLLYLYWNASTLAGALLTPDLDDPARFGLDFVFPAVFLALLTGLCKGRRDILPWAAAALASLACAHLLPGKWYIIAGGLAGGLIGALISGRVEEQA